MDLDEITKTKVAKLLKWKCKNY